MRILLAEDDRQLAEFIRTALGVNAFVVEVLEGALGGTTKVRDKGRNSDHFLPAYCI